MNREYIIHSHWFTKTPLLDSTPFGQSVSAYFAFFSVTIPTVIHFTFSIASYPSSCSRFRLLEFPHCLVSFLTQTLPSTLVTIGLSRMDRIALRQYIKRLLVALDTLYRCESLEFHHLKTLRLYLNF